MGVSSSTKFNFDHVVLVIIVQRDQIEWLINAVNGDPLHVVTGSRLQNRDVEDCFAVPIVNLERFPVGGETGGEAKFIYFQV